VPCLYCDKELKPFRGFFDEDFCSREHREKYFSSFRKALTGFGNLTTQAAAPERPAPSTPAPDPRIADFQPFTLLPLAADTAQHGRHPEMLAVRCEAEIPSRVIAWNAAPDFEERPADLAAPLQGPFATLEPAPAVHDSAPRLAAELGSESAVLALETAGPADSAENDNVTACYSLWMFDEPMSQAPVQLSIPSFYVSAAVPALEPAPMDECAELIVFCEELRSAPVPMGEIAPVHETQIPAFTPACETLQSEEQQESAPDSTEPYWGELYSDPEPAPGEFSSPLSVAPEMAWSSVPVDRPVLSQGNVPAMMPPSLELASARSANVPALSTAVEPQPDLAPELATEFADGEAADSSAAPRSHEPLRLSFGNLVKIKNWRLRITFAKPA